MKKYLAVILTVLTLALSAFAMVACGGNGIKTVSEIAVNRLPEKTEYLKDEPFDAAGGELSVLFRDGSEERIALTQEMCGEADTSTYGEKQLTVTYRYQDTDYTTVLHYSVIYSADSNAFVKSSNALPALNRVTEEHAQAVMRALAAWDALTDDERDFIGETAPRAYEKVLRLQDRLLPVYLAYARSRVAEKVQMLNAGNYTAENWAVVEGIVAAFSSGEYASLVELLAAEERAYAELDAVEKKTDGDITIEEYREQTVQSLLQGMKATLYVIHAAEGTVDTLQKDYAQDFEYAPRVSAALEPIRSAEDFAAVDAAYPQALETIRTVYLEAFARDAKANLAAIVPAWRSLIADTIAQWDGEEISFRGQFDNLPLDYAKDGRWWIPEPYRIPQLLDYVPVKLDAAQTVAQINESYLAFVYEILRAVMQRNLELSYVIERNLDAQYDPTDALYWNHIADYWGASAAQSFVYKGVMDEYVGQVYGNSGSNPYRFSGRLYRDGGPKTVQELVEAYDAAVKALHPEPKRVVGVEISVQPKTQYEAGEPFSVEGGKILVTYNDDTSETLDMTADMYDAAEADMTPNGSYTIELRFTVNGEEHSVTLAYSVAQKRIENVRVTAQPSKTTYLTGETVSVAGGEILVTYNDGSFETVKMTDDMFASSDADTSEAGKKQLTLVFTAQNGDERTVTVSYTVRLPDEKRVASAEVTVAPNTVYELGERFTLSGGKITVTYSDGSSETVEMTDDMYAEEDVDTTSAGEKEVTLTFTVNEEIVTVKVAYTVRENQTLTALLEKIDALPAADKAGAEHVGRVEECLALAEDLTDDARKVFEEVHAARKTKLAGVEKALVPHYGAERAAQRADAYEYFNRFYYTQASVSAIDSAYAALAAALQAAEGFAAVDRAFADYDEVFAAAQVSSATLSDFAAASVRTALALAEKMCVGQIYELKRGTGAEIAIVLKDVSFANGEGVSAAIDAFRAAIEGAPSLQDAEALYEAQIRTLFATVWLEDYRAAAEENVKSLVGAMRDSVRFVWAADGVAEDHSFIYNELGYNVSLDYAQNVDGYLWWTPDAFKVSLVQEKIKVAAGATKEEVFAHYSAAYFEMMRAVMYRNLHTVFAYNAQYHAGQIAGGMWNTLHAYYGSAENAPVYDGTIEEFKGVPVITEGDFRLWYWGWEPDKKSQTLADLIGHYNYDINSFLTEEQQHNGENI